MDIHEESNIIEQTVPVKKMNTTKKKLDNQIKCKEILTKNDCELRNDCMFSKTLKCRKKIQSKLKHSTFEGKKELVRPKMIIIEDDTPETSDFSNLKSSSSSSEKVLENPKVDNPPSSILNNQIIKEKIREEIKDPCQEKKVLESFPDRANPINFFL